MNEWLIILLKYLGVSGSLLLIFLLLRGHVSYQVQRIYLLLIIPLSAVAALVSIDLFGIEHEVISDTVLDRLQELSGEMIGNQGDASGYELSTSASSGESQEAMSINWTLVGWGAVALFFMRQFLLSVAYILRLRRFADRESHDGYMLYRSGLISTSFSFLRSVYMDRQIGGEKFDIILRHELAHINNLHYVDKVIAELYIILSWFNPASWIIRHELCAIHEFQADRTVLNDYDDIKRYKQFLYDEVCGNTPQVANGFNSLLIKKRFLEMKKSYQPKLCLWRKAFTVLAVVGVVTLSSLTYVVGQDAAETIKVTDGTLTATSSDGTAIKKPTLDPENMTVEVTLKDGSTVVAKGSEKVEELMNALTDPNEIESMSFSNGEGTPSSMVDMAQIQVDYTKEQQGEETTCSIPVEPVKRSSPDDKIDFYDASRDKYMVVSNSRGAKIDQKEVVVYKRKDYTEVDIALDIYYDKNWLGFSSDMYLVDTDSGDKYKVHSFKNDMPLDRYMWIEGQKGNRVVLTFIFPPLKSGVKRLELQESVIPGARPGRHDNRSSWTYKNVKILGDKKRAYSDILDAEVITMPADFNL